jgi:hypothetical protein
VRRKRGTIVRSRHLDYAADGSSLAMMNQRTLLWAVAAFIAVYSAAFILLPAYEPKGPPSCYDVEVLGIKWCSRGTYCFIVKFAGTSEQRLVKTYVDKPFTDNYVGPAALLIQTGMLTRSDSYQFKENCVVGHKLGGT